MGVADHLSIGLDTPSAPEETSGAAHGGQFLQDAVEEQGRCSGGSHRKARDRESAHLAWKAGLSKVEVAVEMPFDNAGWRCV